MLPHERAVRVKFTPLAYGADKRLLAVLNALASPNLDIYNFGVFTGSGLKKLGRLRRETAGVNRTKVASNCASSILESFSKGKPALALVAHDAVPTAPHAEATAADAASATSPSSSPAAAATSAASAAHAL